MQQQVPVEKALERKYPEQVALILTRSPEGKINLMAVGWITLVSDDPFMFLIGVDHPAYTLELIRSTGEFVIAYPSREMAKETLFAGTVHGHNIDKGKESGLKFLPGTGGKVPILADAAANFECQLTDEFCPGNCPLIVGKVTASHINPDLSIQRLMNCGKGYQLQ